MFALYPKALCQDQSHLKNKAVTARAKRGWFSPCGFAMKGTVLNENLQLRKSGKKLAFSLCPVPVLTRKITSEA